MHTRSLLTSTSRRAAVAAAVVAAAVFALSGCSAATTSSESAAAESESGFTPVEIEHAFGVTEITERPERIVTLGVGSEDALIALGVAPVAIPFNSYGADESGVRPWIADGLADLGADSVVLPNSDAPAYEEIIGLKPDLILATYSGITAEEYDLLSAIAPTVAYPGEAWSTPWRDVILTAGRAVGQETEAQAVLDDIDEKVAAAASANPVLEGKSAAFVWDSAGTFYVYTTADPRVEFGLDLGLVDAPAVNDLDDNAGSVTYTLSYERLSELTSDILVSFASTEEEAQAFLNSPAAQTMPQVRSGAVASLVGAELIAAVSPPTALSLTWGLDEFVAALADAAEAQG